VGNRGLPCEQACTLDLAVHRYEHIPDGVELADRLPELFAVGDVRPGRLESPACDPD
jgi:hypothetical protein